MNISLFKNPRQNVILIIALWILFSLWIIPSSINLVKIYSGIDFFPSYQISLLQAQGTHFLFTLALIATVPCIIGCAIIRSVTNFCYPASYRAFIFPFLFVSLFVFFVWLLPLRTIIWLVSDMGMTFKRIIGLFSILVFMTAWGLIARKILRRNCPV